MGFPIPLRTAILALASCLFTLPAGAVDQPKEPAFNTEALGKLDLDRPFMAIRVSTPDGCHVALLSRGSAMDSNVVSVDGTAGPEFNGILNRTPVFSPESSRVIYGARVGERWIVFEHGKSDPDKCPKWNRVLENGFSFSGNGAHMAYVAKREGWYVVADGKENGPYEDLTSLPVYSKNGNRLVYGIRQGNQQMIVDNGQPGPVFEGVGVVAVSQDGKRLAYCAQQDGRQFVVVDGKRGDLYGGIFGESLQFSTDGKHVAYAVQKGMQRVVVIDGKEETDLGTIVGNSLKTSPNGNRLGYIARKGDAWLAVVDGALSPEYCKVESLIFSADSKHAAYVAGDETSRFVIHDDEPGPEFPEIVADSLIFSPSEAAYAYRAVQNDKKTAVMLNGKAIGAYDNVGPLSFSPDGRHLAYRANTGEALSVYVDGHRVFGPTMVVCEPVFRNDGVLEFITLKEKTLCRMTTAAFQ